MNLEALSAFVAIANHGSILGASRAGAGSRTTLRRRLDELEELIGVVLADRTPDGVKLTPAGDVLASRAAMLLAEADALARTTREVALEQARPVRVAIPPGPPSYASIRMFQFLRSALPSMRVSLQTHRTAVHPDPREVDIWITYSQDVSSLRHRVFSVGQLDFLLLAAPQYLANHAAIESVADLNQHPLLLWRGPGEDFPTSIPLLGGDAHDVEPAFVTDDAHVLHEMAAAGCGIAFVPHRWADEDPDEFAAVLPDVVGAKRTLHLLVARAGADSPQVRRLSEIIEALILQEPVL